VIALAICMVVFLVVGCVVVAVSEKQGRGPSIDLMHIEQRKNAAMDDIRRRRQYAEDQLRRLSRWQ
jgi:hypothetical protein